MNGALDVVHYRGFIAGHAHRDVLRADDRGQVLRAVEHEMGIAC